MIDDPQSEVYQETRPWGRFEQFTHNTPSTVKLIYVKPGEELSLQYHHKRREFWRVVAGDPIITLDQEVTQAKAGDEFHVRQGQIHRLAGGESEGVILEIAFGDFDEDDIIRVEDVYGRETPDEA